MKYIFVLFLLSYGLFAADAEEAARVLGVENNFEIAIKKAKDEKKLLVMVVVKEHCRWCDKLINTTLSDKKVKKELENFVTLIVNKDDTFPSVFKENFFPSIFYIDYESEESLYENVGYVGSKCFLNDLGSSQEIHSITDEENDTQE